MIFLDTPGKWVTEGANQDGQVHWRELIGLLRKYRGRQPLDGLIVVVPADDLMNLSEAQLEDQAANIREVVDLIHTELNFRFPIYLLVTKADLVEGFVDFFKVLPPKRRHQILGWSNEDPNFADAGKLIERGFQCINRHLADYRPELLAKVFKRTQARRLFFFAEEFKALEQPLAVFTEALFSGDRYSDSPVFRGFYFSSGTQEGAPLSRAVAELARTLGVPAARAQEADEGDKKRSYFLLDLFRQVMVRDEGLVGRTAGHRWRLRRNTFLGAFAPAGIGLLFLVLSLIAFLRNNSTYARIESSAGRITQELARLQTADDFGKVIRERIELTEELRGLHSQLVGFNLFRRFGMRRPGALESSLYALYDREFKESVLAPTLLAARDYAMDEERSCVDRIGVLHSVIWLRMGRRAGYEQLEGLDPAWGLEAEHRRDEADEVRRLLRRQFSHLKQRGEEGSEESLLAGFEAREVARSIAADCSEQGSLSSLALYVKFQDRCQSRPTPDDIDRCWDLMREALQKAGFDYEKFNDKFSQLRSDLTQLKAEVDEAEAILDELEGIDLEQHETSDCLAGFDRDVTPLITEYAMQDALLVRCKEAVDAASSMGEKYKIREKILAEQRQELEPALVALSRQVTAFNSSCKGGLPGFNGLDVEILTETSFGRRRLDCLRDAPPRAQPVAPPPAEEVAQVVQAAPVHRASSAAAPPAPRREASSPYQLLGGSCGVNSSYEPARWDALKADWEAQLGAVEAQFDLKEYEEQQVGNAVRGYGASYARAWLEYLKCLELRGMSGGTAAGWLRKLAETKEYGLAIGRAVKAAALAERAGDGPYAVLAEQLLPLEPLLDLDLETYQSALGAVADDLEACENDPVKFQQYRATLLAGDRNNSLVEAQEWVRRSAGPAVLEGSLTGLFLAPLETAEQFVRGDSLLRAQWHYLAELYDKEIHGRPPFGGDLLADEALAFDTIKALLGGETGAVARIRHAAAGEELSAEAQAWLARAESISSLLFESGSDAPREVKFTMDLEMLPAPEFEKSFRLEEVKMDFGAGAAFEWDHENGIGNPVVQMPLVGESSSIFSVLKSGVAEQKGLVGKTFGGNWKPAEGFDAVAAHDAEVPARAEKSLAPLKLLALGRGAGETLDYALEIPKGKKTVRVDLKFRLSGPDAAKLLDLIDHGLGAPPASVR
jgi:hypothetical protein